MALDIRIPFGKGKGGAAGVAGGAIAGSSKSDKIEKENSREVKNLTKGVVAGNLITKGLMAVMSDVLKVFQPLIRLISLLVFIAFLPLLPLITDLTKAVGNFVGKFAEAGGGIKGLEKVVSDQLKDANPFKRIMTAVVTGIIAILAIAAIAILAGLSLPFVLVIAAIVGIAALIYLAWDDYIGPAFEKIVDGLTWAWEQLVAIFQAVNQAFHDFEIFVIQLGKDIGQWFLDAMKPFTDAIQAVIRKINDIAGSIGKKISKGFDFVKGLVGLADGGIVNRPTPALIGEAGPEAVIPLNKLSGMGMTININNPTIRDDADIRKLTDQISRELQKRGNRGFSGI